ncbi:purine-nucleoside phosphorylase [Thermomicrobiaceae bacterium CFH 74404]|uniref:Purine nucleoside phosphorylase n=1 Tax=Thermalbibacter longus TaxID=2951981 RepID=A0AA41WFH6_9BACT|nr:purine-nucleoside phosphorylase [Thermalbibacter longus]MCM8748461.1 purine-nucleoside phosphorylase [Thermalbibacter longus]
MKAGIAQNEAARRLASLCAGAGVQPRVAVIAGSGLGALAERVEVARREEMDRVLGVAAPPVGGHARELLLGSWAGVPVLLFLGRYHLYQGLSAAEVATPVAALAGSTVRALVVTNAAGGIDERLQPGDLMLIADHLFLPGLAGQSPLIRPSSQAGIEFVPMRDAYDPELRALARQVASELGLPMREGVYAMVAGPSYETSAELRMLRLLGAQAVGMSTAPEVVMARALGIRVLGISVITNRAVPEETKAPSHEEVLEAGRRAGPLLARLIEQLLPGLVESTTARDTLR